VTRLIDTWFRRLTDKAPVAEMLTLLDPDSLTMVFPEGSFSGEDGFRTWYAAVTARYFDQVHELRVLDVELHGERGDVDLTVDWQARIWQPPDPYSGWTGGHATQHWTVRRRNGAAVITDYRVIAIHELTGPRRLPF
jgi:hypothetical protein